MLTYFVGVIDLNEQKLDSANPSGHLGNSQVIYYNLQFVIAVHFVLIYQQIELDREFKNLYCVLSQVQ